MIISFTLGALYTHSNSIRACNVPSASYAGVRSVTNNKTHVLAVDILSAEELTLFSERYWNEQKAAMSLVNLLLNKDL